MPSSVGLSMSVEMSMSWPHALRYRWWWFWMARALFSHLCGPHQSLDLNHYSASASPHSEQLWQSTLLGGCPWNSWPYSPLVDWSLVGRYWTAFTNSEVPAAVSLSAVTGGFVGLTGTCLSLDTPSETTSGPAPDSPCQFPDMGLYALHPQDMWPVVHIWNSVNNFHPPFLLCTFDNLSVAVSLHCWSVAQVLVDVVMSGYLAR